jgi:hypothetical protein
MAEQIPGFIKAGSGLWVPDIKKAGLEALKKPEVADYKKYAKKNCKICHGTGEMRQTHGNNKIRWTICLCVEKRFPPGEKNTEALIEAEKQLRARKEAEENENS